MAKAKGRTTILIMPPGQARNRLNADERLLQLIADYLKRKGWAPAVISADRIQHVPSDHRFNYELVFRFTGGRIVPK